MLRSDSLMRKIAEDLFPLVHAVSPIILVSTMLLLSFPWQLFSSVSAQDDEGEEDDIETAGTNNRNGIVTIIVSL